MADRHPAGVTQQDVSTTAGAEGKDPEPARTTYQSRIDDPARRKSPVGRARYGRPTPAVSAVLEIANLNGCPGAALAVANPGPAPVTGGDAAQAETPNPPRAKAG